MAYENPPQDASPKNLLALCAALTDGSRSVDELEEDSVLDLSTSVIRDSMRYGTRMGFIAQDEEEKLSLSDRGWDIAFTNDVDESVEEAFRVGIQDYGLYSDLIDKIIEEGLPEEGEPEQITQEQILPLLNRSFGFSELSTDSTLRPATNTFLQTLDAAGYGDYIIGRGDNPTRIELNDDFLQLTRESRKKGGDEPEEVGGEQVGESEDESGEMSESPAGGGEPAPDQEVSTTVAGTEVNIEIQISSADWSSDEVVELIESLQSDDE